jgi:hypothetical protein
VYRVTPHGCAGVQYYHGGDTCIYKTCTAATTPIQYSNFDGCACDSPPQDGYSNHTALLAPSVCTPATIHGMTRTDRFRLSRCLAAGPSSPLTSEPTALETLPPVYFSYIDRITGVKAGYGLNVCTAYSENSGLSIMYKQSPNVLSNFYGPGLHAIEVSVTEWSSTTCSGNQIGTSSIRYPVSAATALAAGKATYGEYSMHLPQDGGATGATLKK